MGNLNPRREPKKRANVLVTDLDNTVWNWFEIWYRPFSAMLDAIVKKSGIPAEVLEPQIRAIHQKHHTSEYSYLIESLPALLDKHPGENLVKTYEEAIRVFREKRREVLRLYDDNVLLTLEAAKAKGALIVAYTESQEFHTGYRMRKTGLDHVMDYLYTSPDHEGPEVPPRLYSDETYVLVHTEPRTTKPGELKPNPALLLDILEQVGADKDSTVYVGDSLMKDIAMAKDAGVYDIHARYGEVQKKPEYELLRRVSHWSDADVKREKEIAERPHVEPTATIDKFSELSDWVEFFAFPKR